MEKKYRVGIIGVGHVHVHNVANIFKRHPRVELAAVADTKPDVEEKSQVAYTRKWNFDYLRDESQDLARTFGAQRTPEVFVFDADRRLRYQGGIDDSWEDESGVTKTPLRDALEALLDGREPSPTSTPAVGCSIKWNP